jgi:hypothetical protein
VPDSIGFTILGVLLFASGLAAAVFPSRINAPKNKRKRRFWIVRKATFLKLPIPCQVGVTFISGLLAACVGSYLFLLFPIEIAVPYSAKRLFASQSASSSPTGSGSASKQKVDPIVRTFFEEKEAVGMVVGFVTREENGVLGYDKTALCSDSVPDPDTVYEIESSYQSCMTAFFRTGRLGGVPGTKERRKGPASDLWVSRVASTRI